MMFSWHNPKCKQPNIERFQFFATLRNIFTVVLYLIDVQRNNKLFHSNNISPVMWIQFRPKCPPLVWSVEIALNKIQNWNQKLLLPVKLCAFVQVLLQLLNVRIKRVNIKMLAHVPIYPRGSENEVDLKHMELSRVFRFLTLPQLSTT